MRLGDLDALKRAIEDRIDQIPANDFDVGWNNAINAVIDEIDNAPVVTSKVEFVTKNGITFPKALEMMTYSHELTTEERQNIEKAYMLGVYSNARPQGGKWITIHFEPNEFNAPEKSKLDFVQCPFCESIHQGRHNFCSRCGADMRGDE